jgi:hypothetical protein
LDNSSILKTSDHIAVHVFDESVRKIDNLVADSLKLNGQRTDIERALRYITDNGSMDNTQAIVLFTDGAFNSGANPIYQAEQAGKPVYIIGIGDSTEPKDASIQSLVTNDVAYVGNVIPVNVSLKIAGFSSGDAAVTLYDNGNKISEQSVAIRQEQQNYSLLFEYKAQQDGNHKLTVSVKALDGELTERNNSISEFVNVLSNKRKIALFAGAPSPDLSFIRSSIESDKSLQLKTFIQKTGSEFYDEAPNASSIREAEVILLVGFPIQSTPQSVMQIILNELQRGKPLLFITSQQVDYNKLRMLDDYMPFTVQTSRTNEFTVLADVKESQSTNPLLRIKGTAEDIGTWNQLPPVFRTETFVRVKPESEVLATMKVNNVSLADPLIVSRNFQKSKTVAVLGYGLYRWKLLGNAVEQTRGRTELPDVLTSFLLNSTKWLTTNDEQKTVRIRSSKKFYSSGERVEFIGQVYDAAFAPIENATVTVKVNGANEPREIVLNNSGNGRYTATLDGLGEGDYSYAGTVAVNNKSYGADAGRFSIGDVGIEYQNLRMNVELLRTIADRTGGKFYTLDNADKLLNDIKSNKRFQPRIISQTNEFALWNLAYLLAASLFCFALEWFLRKRAGMV